MIVKACRRPRQEITLDDSLPTLVDLVFNGRDIPEPTLDLNIPQVKIRSGLIEMRIIAPRNDIPDIWMPFLSKTRPVGIRHHGPCKDIQVKVRFLIVHILRMCPTDRYAIVADHELSEHRADCFDDNHYVFVHFVSIL